MSTSNDPRQSASGQERTDNVRIRRAPKFATFLILGGGLGAVVTFILTALFPVDPNVGFGALFGYFALYGVTGGVLLGALVAIILDRRADRHATEAVAVIETTDAADVPEFNDSAPAAPTTAAAPLPATPDAPEVQFSDPNPALPVDDSGRPHPQP